MIVVATAFAGADSVLWLVPPNPRAENVEAAYVDVTRPACAALTSQGVKRVVGISAIEVLGKSVRFQQIPGEAFKARLAGCGTSEAMAQGTLDMMLAKNAGLDNAEPRTPQSTTQTSFRQWCEDVLKPAVLA
jgi:hypothetical protein